jgi:hypothetical protein
MADEAVEVMTSFCAQERIVALNGLADTSLDEHVRRSAAMRSEQIAISESFYINKDNN